MSTVDVPFTLALGAAGDGLEPLLVRVEGPGSTETLFASAEAGGEPAVARAPADGGGGREVMIKPNVTGKLTFTQTEGQTSFALSLGMRAGRGSRRFDAPDAGFPADDARSTGVEAGPAARTAGGFAVPFKLARAAPGDRFRVWLRSARGSTRLGRLELDGKAATSEAVAPYAHEFQVPAGSGLSGRVTFEQELAAEATVWVEAGGSATAVAVAAPVSAAPAAAVAGKRGTAGAESIVNASEPVQSKAVDSSQRMPFDNPTAVNVGGRNYRVTVPFRLDVPAAPPGSSMRVSWELDPSSTVFRELRVGDGVWTPDRALGGNDAFEAAIPTPAAGVRGAAVFDQPMGRRPFRVNLEFAGERAGLRIAGDPPEPRSAGFIADRRPPEASAGQPPIRFMDTHESADRRVSSVFESLAGVEPDEATRQFLVGKYLEWDGDMGKVQNLVSSIATMASEDPDADSVRRAVATLQSGATPGAARDALRDWREYETYRAMWRPDAGAGGAGESALKRPWSQEAGALAQGLRSGAAAVPSNALAAF
jgi:hypothetical protein